MKPEDSRLSGIKPDEAFLARRRQRNIALGLVLAGLAVLFFAITIARMG